jgi:outer membrane protein TolC
MKNRFYALLISFIVSFPLATNAQVVLDSLIPENQVLDLLVETALNNSPHLKSGVAQISMNEYQRKMISNEWMGRLQAGGNLNEVSIKRFDKNVTGIPNTLYPRYNFGVAIPLNTFSEIRNSKKINEQEKVIIEYQLEDLKRIITETVKKQYVTLLKYEYTLVVKRNLEQYVIADFNAKEKKFSDGSLELAEYSEARRQRANFSIEIFEAENNYFNAKTELETTLGVTLESLGL